MSYNQIGEVILFMLGSKEEPIPRDLLRLIAALYKEQIVSTEQTRQDLIKMYNDSIETGEIIDETMKKLSQKINTTVENMELMEKRFITKWS